METRRDAERTDIPAVDRERFLAGCPRCGGEGYYAWRDGRDRWGGLVGLWQVKCCGCEYRTEVGEVDRVRREWNAASVTWRHG